MRPNVMLSRRKKQSEAALFVIGWGFLLAALTPL
ncbi:hypothetical protein BDD21_4600 [Thiocapsa rosea]|uniref:Uncharacterized protein n=1 Tax=Thiocapsa rosea TaxID=69360 RepID=A0A495VE21_9GAMM|nr:hypothetical protein BDD21_4600 [Thiocapsa rosea]